MPVNAGAPKRIPPQRRVVQGVGEEPAVAVGLGCGPLPREDDEGLGVEVGRCEGWVLVGFGVGPPVETVGVGAGGVGVA